MAARPRAVDSTMQCCIMMTVVCSSSCSTIVLIGLGLAAAAAAAAGLLALRNVTVDNAS